jgi:hypothetical protein
MTPPYRSNAPMPMDLKVALRGLSPTDAQTMLTQAQQAYFNLLIGQMPSGVETPQLGRVTFAATSAADLQRLIDYLNGVVTAGASGGYGSSGVNVRKPISFFGWP